MTSNDAGGNASNCTRTPMGSDAPSTKLPISPAARKLAENIARRLIAKIEYARRQTTTANQRPTNNL
jgi:hypothetical protein